MSEHVRSVVVSRWLQTAQGYARTIEASGRPAPSVVTRLSQTHGVRLDEAWLCPYGITHRGVLHRWGQEMMMCLLPALHPKGRVYLIDYKMNPTGVAPQVFRFQVAVPLPDLPAVELIHV